VTGSQAILLVENLWSYASRYCGLSNDTAFEETVFADQGHGSVACLADMTLQWIKENTQTMSWGQLKFKIL